MGCKWTSGIEKGFETLFPTNKPNVYPLNKWSLYKNNPKWLNRISDQWCRVGAILAGICHGICSARGGRVGLLEHNQYMNMNVPTNTSQHFLPVQFFYLKMSMCPLFPYSRTLARTLFLIADNGFPQTESRCIIVYSVIFFTLIEALVKDSIISFTHFYTLSLYPSIQLCSLFTGDNSWDKMWDKTGWVKLHLDNRNMCSHQNFY